ncbi:MAG: class I SAM-dependent methyltransferase [Bacillota bacterium]|nr:MAG: class I SAM-dependent methyltransferase [Bacillota bacterium]
MYEHLSKYYNRIFTFSDQITKWIKPFTKVDGFAIDLGCGTGRLTKVIYDLGMKTLGIDVDSHMIEVAKKDFPKVDFSLQNMLNAFDSPKTYDLVTCFGNTIVHLNKKELDLLFQKLNEKLKIHGYVIFQTLNYDSILENKPSQLKTIEQDDLSFIRTYTYEQDYIVFKTELSVEGKNFSGSTRIYPYTMNDFLELAKKYDFHVTIYGDLVKDYVDSNATHIYYVFRF